MTDMTASSVGSHSQDGGCLCSLLRAYLHRATWRGCTLGDPIMVVVGITRKNNGFFCWFFMQKFSASLSERSSCLSNSGRFAHLKGTRHAVYVFKDSLYSDVWTDLNS